MLVALFVQPLMPATAAGLSRTPKATRLNTQPASC
jgi:hypothetical protein